MKNKEKGLIGLLLLEGVICILFCLISPSFPGLFTSVFAFPFEQIAAVLKFFSLHSQGGNLAAIGLYILIGLAPLVFFIYLKRKNSSHREEGLLLLLSPLLFVALYYMINPAFLPSVLTGAMGKAFLGSVLYSIIIGYGVLKLLRLVTRAETTKLTKITEVFLGLLAALFVFMAFGLLFARLLIDIGTLKNNGITQAGYLDGVLLGEVSFFSTVVPNYNLPLSYVVVVLNYFINALPHVLNVLVIFSGLRLLEALKENPYANKTMAAVDNLLDLCKKSLIAVILSTIAVNVFQLIFMNTIMILNTLVQVPFYALLFLLAVLLLARYFKGNKQLKEEMDQFI